MFDEKFYSDGAVRVYRFTLRKDGFTPIKIRKHLGQWDYLAYRSNIGDERWAKIVGFTETQILEHIKLYGSEK